MPADIALFGAIVLIVAVIGVAIGMLVAPLVARIGGDDRAEAEGDGSDEPS